jgi:hypothetical protein
LIAQPPWIGIAALGAEPVHLRMVIKQSRSVTLGLAIGLGGASR